MLRHTTGRYEGIFYYEERKIVESVCMRIITTDTNTFEVVGFGENEPFGFFKFHGSADINHSDEDTPMIAFSMHSKEIEDNDTSSQGDDADMKMID